MKQETEISMLTLHCQIILLKNDKHSKSHDIQKKWLLQVLALLSFSNVIGNSFKYFA